MSTTSTSVTSASAVDRNAILRLPKFRYLLAARLCSALGTTSFATVIGYQLYQLTKDPLALGWLGLIESLPALPPSLLGSCVTLLVVALVTTTMPKLRQLTLEVTK